MDYKIYDITDSQTNPRFDILHDAVEVLINDDNLKPYWVESPAQYTEFYIKRNKKNLLIVVGESWTYGETMKGIATAIRKFNFHTQLEFCFGSRLALILDTDLYQYAVPGNCNFYMFTELDRILKHVSSYNYEKIYVCQQMTEPSREQALIVQLKEKSHRLADLIQPTRKMTFEQWLEEYDEIFFDQYESIISQYKNLDCILWKNFCKINSKNTNRKFKIIDKTWIEYSATMLGKKIQSPSFFTAGWIETITELYTNVIFDRPKILNEFDQIEESYNFIKANSLHSHHPNEFGHLLWAQYLARKSGWKNDI